MSIDPEIAAALGFPKLRYTAVERERRWICRQVPRELVLRTEAISDLYVTGTRLRLREARPLEGGAPMLRLTRKADVDPRTRLITSIYLPEHELQILRSVLQGVRIEKLRHRLRPVDGVTMSVDEFGGSLSGLVMAEAELDTDEQLEAFPTPTFALREVTDDLRFTGGQLATVGLPREK